MDIQLNSLIADGREYFYWLSEPEEYNKTIIYFPSGSSNGWTIHRFGPPNFPKTRFIGIDYPGRGMMSMYKGHNQITQIAKFSVDFIKSMDIRNPIFLGHSFGTAVVTETLRYDSNLAHLIVLIQPGEFIGFGLHQLAKLTLNRAKKKDELWEKIVTLYKQYAGSNFPPGSFWFDNSALREQADAINDYKVDSSLRTTVKTLLIHSKKDELVRPKSREKLKKIFINRLEIEINRRHTMRSKDFEDYRGEILPVASDWIIKNMKKS